MTLSHTSLPNPLFQHAPSPTVAVEYVKSQQVWGREVERSYVLEEGRDFYSLQNRTSVLFSTEVARGLLLKNKWKILARGKVRDTRREDNILFNPNHIPSV